MKLYGYWRSSASYRVRIALALKGLAYDYEAVNLLEGEQGGDAYRKRNAAALVPTLVADDGAVVTQSMAIIEYLEEIAPETPLLAGGPGARAQARAFASTLACEAQPFMNLRIQRYLRDERDFDEAALSEWLNRWPGGAMAAAEAILERSAGDFCIGDAPGLADCFLVPQMYAAARFGVDLSGLPNMRAVNERCLAHPAFEKAHPNNQPDAPT